MVTSTRNEAANEINIPSFSSHIWMCHFNVITILENWKVTQKYRFFDISRIPLFQTGRTSQDLVVIELWKSSVNRRRGHWSSVNFLPVTRTLLKFLWGKLLYCQCLSLANLKAVMIIILTKTECPLFMNKVYGLALRLGGGGGGLRYYLQ